MKRIHVLPVLLLWLLLSSASLPAMGQPAHLSGFRPGSSLARPDSRGTSLTRQTSARLPIKKAGVDGERNTLARSAIIILSSCTEASLRNAIASAASGDSIHFDMSTPCTITLTGSPITINKNLTLDASASPQPVTLSGGNTVQVLVVNSGFTLTLDALTITQGRTTGNGGGLLNSGTVHINQSTFTGNFAIQGGGIYNTGTLNINQSTFSNDTVSGTNSGGGGLENFGGTVHINQSLFTLNAAFNGGAINNNSGTMTITLSTFTNNSTTNVAAGIYSLRSILNIDRSSFTDNRATGHAGALDSLADDVLTISHSLIAHNSAAEGGGLYTHAAGVINVSNSTIAYNTARTGGGLFDESGGTLHIGNSTIAFNTATQVGGGGGIQNAGTATMQIAQSIVANNTTAGIANNCVGTMTDLGYNLDSGTSCSFTAPTSLRNTNPQLDPALANNGGPTQTLALLPGSPAINVIPPAVCLVTDDQRGVSRPQGPACDIGAFEVGAFLTLTVPELIETHATSPAGAVVHYDVSASSPFFPPEQLTITCTPPSGSTFPVGTTTVTCTAHDPEGRSVTESFQVIVTQGTPPTLHVPGIVEVHATSPAGAVVNYDTLVTATSPNFPPDQLTIVCNPPSGSVFPIGTTTVICTAHDPAGNSTTESFQIVVTQATAPDLIVPDTIIEQATSPAGAVVQYNVSASSPVFPLEQITITCTPPSGSTFPIGTTTVHCTARDPSGASSSASFLVIINASAPPTLNVPELIEVPATSAQGAVVHYDVSVTSPIFPPEQITITCTPASGSPFPVGETAVHCTARDPAGNIALASFPVVVTQGTSLTLHVPATITVQATSPAGAVVHYTVSATSPTFPPEQITITCTPPSGSTFPIGTTTVHCTARDPAGNTAQASFLVVVTPQEVPQGVLTLRKTADRALYRPSERVIYTISAGITGGVLPANITLTLNDMLPAVLKILNVVSTPVTPGAPTWHVTIVGNAITATFTTVTAGERVPQLVVIASIASGSQGNGKCNGKCKVPPKGPSFKLVSNMVTLSAPNLQTVTATNTILVESTSTILVKKKGKSNGKYGDSQ